MLNSFAYLKKISLMEEEVKNRSLGVIKAVFADLHLENGSTLEGYISNEVVKCSLGRKFIILPDKNIIYRVLETFPSNILPIIVSNVTTLRSRGKLSNA